jgi:ankyrin repeat protein
MVAEAFGCHLTLPQCPQELSDFEATKNLLCGAIVLGCIPLVKSLLEKPQTSSPMDLDTCCNGFGFPLSLAAAWGHIEIVSYLIKKGANPRRCEVYRDKPWRNGEHFRSIRAGRGRDAWNSALSAAAYGGHEEIVELLMKPENRISPLTLEYFTSIIAAARGGHWGIIQRLLRDTGKSIQDHAERLITECFWEAVYNNHQHVVQMLLDSGADIDKFPCTRYYFGYYTNALGIASSLGNLTMFRFLIERGANPTHCKIQPRWFSPIYCASRCGHEEIVGQLLDLGADPATALYGACDGGQVHLVKLLFERYPDIPSRKRFGDVSHGLPVGLEVLRLAIRIKNPSLISFLVRKGVSLNDGYPEPRFLPIVIAKTESAKWITQHLLSLGAVDQELPEDCKQHNVERYLEEIPEFNYDRMYHFNYRQRGGVMITKRTWEWVGNR